MNRLSAVLFIIGGSFLASACAGGGAKAGTTPADESTAASHGDEHAAHVASDETPAMGPCPATLMGADITAVDTGDGAALVFAGIDDLEALRSHVRRMAEMHAMHSAGDDGKEPADEGGHGHGGGGMHGEMHGGGGGMHGGGAGHGAKMAGVGVAYEDTDGGARLLFKASGDSELTAVREHVRMMAGHMAMGHCPMKGMMPGTASGAETSPGGADDSEHSAHHP